MNQFIIDIDIHEERILDFFALIPDQRDQINKLISEGRISSVTLSSDRQKMWITMFGSSEENIISILNTFVLIKSMDYKITQLMFHISNTQFFPQLFLN